MSKQCPNCKNMLQDQTRYCDRCGAPQFPQSPISPILPPQPPNTPKKKNTLFRIMLIFMLIFLMEGIGLSGLVLFAKLRERNSTSQTTEQTQILIDQSGTKEASLKKVDVPTERKPLEINREDTTSAARKKEEKTNSDTNKKEQKTNSDRQKTEQPTPSDTKKTEPSTQSDGKKKEKEATATQAPQDDIPQQAAVPSSNPTFDEFLFYENDIAVNGIPSSAVTNGAGTAGGSWKYCLFFNFNMINEAQIKEVGLADVRLTDQSASLVLHPQQLLMGGEITPETDEGVGYQPFTGTWTNETMDLNGNGVVVNFFSFYSIGGYDYALGTTLKTSTGMSGVIVLMRP